MTLRLYCTFRLRRATENWAGPGKRQTLFCGSGVWLAELVPNVSGESGYVRLDFNRRLERRDYSTLPSVSYKWLRG